MGFRSLTFTKERDQQQLRGMYVHALCVMPVWVVLRCLQYSMARAILVIVIVRQTVQNYWKRWYFCLVDLQSLEPVPCGSNTPHLVYLLSTILYNYLKITTSWTDSCQDSKIAKQGYLVTRLTPKFQKKEASSSASKNTASAHTAKQNQLREVGMNEKASSNKQPKPQHTATTDTLLLDASIDAENQERYILLYRLIIINTNRISNNK